MPMVPSPVIRTVNITPTNFQGKATMLIENHSTSDYYQYKRSPDTDLTLTFISIPREPKYQQFLFFYVRKI